MKRIGINGLGRVGRIILRQYISNPREDFEIVAANDLDSVSNLSYLIAHDSVHGRAPFAVSHGSDNIELGEKRIAMFRERDPGKIPWKDCGVDIVLECTGVFRSRAEAAKHIEAGASKVILSAFSDDADVTIVMGVNEHTYDPVKHGVISNASCTTNSLAPVAKVLDESFGIDALWATTVHAYTSSQALIDKATRKVRRGRAAALSIVPTTTGAANATCQVIPSLQGKMDAIALRVPIPDGSVTDIVARLRKDATRDEINAALKKASEGSMEGIIEFSEEELVSIDIIGNPHVAIIDSEFTQVVGENMAKVLVWYDNEWGFSNSMLKLTSYIISRGWR